MVFLPFICYCSQAFQYMADPVRFTKKEERANALSHLSGTFLSIAGLVLMAVYSSKNGDAWHVVSTAIFGATLILLYASSTITHWLKPGRLKDLFFTIDQVAIFFLIAGTYTPLTLVVLHGAFGWTIFGVEWALALMGSVMKILNPTRYEGGVNYFYILLYAGMGWLFLVVIVPVIRILPTMGWLWIVIGGLCYTLGILFYKKARFRYHHLVWHLLVIGGSISHFFAIFLYIIPLEIPV